MAVTAILGGCANRGGARSDAAEQAQETTLKEVAVNPDSLYHFVEAQVALGPRTPGSKAHAQCVELIQSQLRRMGVDTVELQRAPVTTFKGERFTAQNILGRINPSATDRVLFLAHYDTRPWADNDPDAANHSTPVMGANDGGSGVACLLEAARVLAPTLPDSLGLDLLFVDMEDSGESNSADEDELSWCLGSQEWIKALPYTGANRPRFGILFDMVGGQNARFHREYFSQRHAAPILNKVWDIARRSGFSDRFINETGGGIVDDHLWMNRAGIPCINIIESRNPDTGAFNPTWHTVNDDLLHIDRASLKAAAQTAVNSVLN